ncbi:gamma-glutamyltransferase [Alginatibacterium sediminis]|uniref:Glutathione hydrolase proenzyme n=1 Tax=Alginatibacterium sediminis TaxID=2164068 RepID=A0A420E8F7_9ALTE|nr:gamma-glutamyltransferase [Alginatibacterium sediminis]RKF15647.1 gamma-glutamyltransferase [Alginatibacterium sediminis]
MKKLQLQLAISIGLMTSFSLAAEQAADSIAPEPASSLEIKDLSLGSKFMVSAANPLASQAGYDVLKQGGSAIDAMIAVQTVLGLVEPQSSGLGGGAFLVYYDAQSKQTTTFDARETAPLAATPELFLDEQGQPLKFFDAVVGGRSVGTPGTVKLLGDMHDQFGKTAWNELLSPAIELATEGFKVSPRLASMIAADQERLSTHPDTLDYFFDSEGSPLKEGVQLKNPEYAETLELLAEHGADYFYRGEMAQTIVDKVQAVSNPGVLELIDFVSYTVKQRPAVCQAYREFEVCGMGPPSSGALTLGQILGVLNHFDFSEYGPNDPVTWQIIGDASRLAFADRGRYMADSDYVPMPKGLLNADYLAQRAALITPGTALAEVSAGEPLWEQAPVQAYAMDESIEFPSTSHISIVDAAGNMVSMTTTIENGFGSRVMSQGFLLNNELTDFSFRAHSNGYPIANRIEPGKRPRSSMAPTIVLKDDKPYLVIGSPGGSRIIGYVAQAIIAHLDWGMEIQEAIDSPHLVNRFGSFDIEAGQGIDDFKAELEKLGYEKVNIRDLNSGIHAVLIHDGQLIGAADSRREGLALGE